MVLLVIGILGLAASIFNFFSGASFFDILTGLIASCALIYGYFYFKKPENSGQQEE